MPNQKSNRVQYNVEVTAGEKETLRYLAKRFDLSMSEVIRRITMNTAIQIWKFGWSEDVWHDHNGELPSDLLEKMLAPIDQRELKQLLKESEPA